MTLSKDALTSLDTAASPDTASLPASTPQRVSDERVSRSGPWLEPGAVFDPTRRVPEAPLWRLAGALLTVATVAGAGVSWWQLAFRQERVAQQVIAGVIALEAHLGAGQVTIRGTDRTDVQLTRTLSWAGLPDSQPGPQETLSGGTLRLDNPCTGHISCSVSYLVEAPHGLRARIEQSSGDVAADSVAQLTALTTSGDVSATGVDELDARTSSGDIVADRIGRARLQTASGSVDASDLVGDSAQVSTISGDVHVHRTQVTRLIVDTTSGDVSVTVSGTPAVDVRSMSRSGRTQINVPTDPAAGQSISVTTSSGDIWIARSS